MGGSKVTYKPQLTPISLRLHASAKEMPEIMREIWRFSDFLLYLIQFSAFMILYFAADRNQI
jgi:hypothetical protein